MPGQLLNPDLGDAAVVIEHGGHSSDYTLQLASLKPPLFLLREISYATTELHSGRRPDAFGSLKIYRQPWKVGAQNSIERLSAPGLRQ
jgi:hypothetical protein